MSTAGNADDAPRTLLRVVRGDPTPEELAALVAVVGARAAAAPDDAVAVAPSRSAWSDPARAVRTPLRPGPDGWRRSATPR